MRAHDALRLRLGNDRHRAFLLLRPVAVRHAVQQQDVHIVGAQFAAEAVEVRAHFFLRGGAGLGQDRDLLARQFFSAAHMRMRAVLIGAIPEGHALIVGGVEQSARPCTPSLRV